MPEHQSAVVSSFDEKKGALYYVEDVHWGDRAVATDSQDSEEGGYGYRSDGERV